MIKATTLKLVMEDLRKYHNALDKAIMRFHHIKMNDINKSIRDIWQETYQGHGKYTFHSILKSLFSHIAEEVLLYGIS